MECRQIIEHIEKLAPATLAAEWDNVGLQVGLPDTEVTNVLVSLDLNTDVVSEALENNVQLIVTHHPLLFRPIKTIVYDDYKGKLIYSLIRNNISYYCAHTNLDFATGGTNDLLARRVGLMNAAKKIEGHEIIFENGRMGELDTAQSLSKFIDILKTNIGIDYVRLIGSVNSIKKVAVAAGSFDRKLLEYISGKVDVIVCGDLKYHDAREIIDSGMCAIDIGHYGSEKIIIDTITQYISELGVNAMASKIDLNPFKYI